MNAPDARPTSDRLVDLAAILTDPRFELGPLDVRDLVAALEELVDARRTAAQPLPEARLVPSAIAQGLRDTGDAAGPGPLQARLQQAAGALDVLCGAVVAALLRDDVADCELGDLLRGALVTAGAK